MSQHFLQSLLQEGTHILMYIHFYCTYCSLCYDGGKCPHQAVVHVIKKKFMLGMSYLNPVTIHQCPKANANILHLFVSQMANITFNLKRLMSLQKLYPAQFTHFINVTVVND